MRAYSKHASIQFAPLPLTPTTRIPTTRIPTTYPYHVPLPYIPLAAPRDDGTLSPKGARHVVLGWGAHSELVGRDDGRRLQFVLDGGGGGGDEVRTASKGGLDGVWTFVRSEGQWTGTENWGTEARFEGNWGTYNTPTPEGVWTLDSNDPRGFTGHDRRGGWTSPMR